MSHQTSRKLKNSKLSEVVAYDGGFTAQGSNVESLLNSTSVHKDVSQVSVTSGSAEINSGAMTVPGNSIIKSCTVIALEDLDVVNGVAAVNVGVSFGTGSAGSIALTGTLDADSFDAATTIISKSFSNSTNADMDRGSQAQLAFRTDQVGTYLDDSSSTYDVYGQVKASAGGFSAGRVQFLTEYINLDSGSIG